MLDTQLTEMKAERNRLKAKIEELRTFKKSEEYIKVDAETRFLVYCQLETLNRYRAVLKRCVMKIEDKQL